MIKPEEDRELVKTDKPEWMKRGLPANPTDEDVRRVNLRATKLGEEGSKLLKEYGEKSEG